MTEFSFDGRRYRQEQDFFLLRVPAWQVDTAGFDAEERRPSTDAPVVVGGRDSTPPTSVYPDDLAALLRRCLACARGADADPAAHRRPPRGGLYALERALQRRGFRHVAGADEAGRGACAGPLVAAAAILPEGRRGEIDGLADSKLLTPAGPRAGLRRGRRPGAGLRRW